MSQDDSTSLADADAEYTSSSLTASTSATAALSSNELRTSHHKRLAQILRYLATMHRGSSNSGASDCFVREYPSASDAREALSTEFFFDNGRSAEVDIGDSSILFSLQDFRTILSSGGEAGLFTSPPFSFYAAADAVSSSSAASGGGKTSKVSVSWEAGNANERSGSRWTMSGWSTTSPTQAARKFMSSKAPPIPSCWLRLTRIKAEEFPPISSPTIRAYLESWAQKRKLRSYKRLIRDLDALNHAPALDATTPARKQKEIKNFLRKCKRHVKRDLIRKKMEPMYNRLFEMAQRTKAADCSFEELILGLGNARMVLDYGDEDGGGGGTTVVNGPLLEVRVEVELAPDGALLVRPCEHTGIELNREVLGAIASAVDGSSAAGRDVLASLHRAVADLETQTLSPGQPTTYASMLKRMAVELCSGGRFVSTMSSAYSSLSASRRGSNKLLVTDSWCFYHRPKPSSVWARDAQTLADMISKHQAAGRPSLLTPTLSPPLAAMSLTHGPNTLTGMSLTQPSISRRFVSSFKSFMGMSTATQHVRPLFPLPTSESQDRIHRLLSEGAPAVVVEGPPGCGKTHSIANIVCSYLARGKRVLVTSKGAPALSVLRQRLPDCMQALCVDVTVSEAAGMQQLQQTVERLADTVSRGIDKTELCLSLANNIKTLEADIAATDAKLESFHKRKFALLQTPKGQELAELSYAVLEEAPWLAATTSQWEDTRFMDFVESVEALAGEVHGYHDVTGYESPPSGSLMAGAAARAGGILPNITGKTVEAMSSLPLLGSVSGAQDYQERKEHELNDIKLYGETPTHRSEWKLVQQVVEHNKNHCSLYESTIASLIEKEGWPTDKVYDSTKDKLCFTESFVDTLRKARQVRKMQAKLLRPCDFDHPVECQHLEVQRQKMVHRLQSLDEKLVEAKVITQLSSMFSPEAQSALIKFAMLAGKSKFRSNAQASRLSARQQRHRQAYLQAFEKCVRYIPCWILTTNQVNDYLPTEFELFDIVIMDEASQSDITALPSMLRGKQWLVVGDGKQVSPTESFTAESQIESLRASLPNSPFRECFLPGHSFFDLCSQAFPIGRVVLSEHFRCSPDIIKFSNDTYYQSRLHPLRLPTSSEVMSPSLVDIYLRNGRKVGKSNEAECNKIVSLIKDMVDESRKKRRSRPKSIGVICLVGDEQSRLIRGRILDAIGPEAYNHHDILVGEPPSFQGSEKDVIFLSMVSSPGAVTTQSQLMYHQRINVALSRAKDRMVLVRSINRSHIPSMEDAKIAVVDFFSEFASKDITQDNPKRVEDDARYCSTTSDAPPMRERVLEHVSEHLRGAGFVVRPMGVVWNHAICVETKGPSGARAAIAIESSGELKQEWKTMILQQRAIERVGWQCFRLDALSWILDHKSTQDMLFAFLRSAGVKITKKKEQSVVLADEVLEDASSNANQAENDADGDDGFVSADEGEDPDNKNKEAPASRNHDEVPDDVVVISSNEEEEEDEFMQVSSDESSADDVKKEDDDDDDGFDPNQYGSVIQLGGFGAASSHQLDDDELDEESVSDLDTKPSAEKKRKRSSQEKESKQASDDDALDSDVDSKKPSAKAKRGKPTRSTATGRDKSSYDSDDDYHGDASSDDEPEGPSKKRRKRRRRRLDAHSRDGRWYPSHEPDKGDDEHMDVEEESWEDLKDVVSTDSSYKDEEDESITSRLRSSAQQDNVQPNEESGIENADMDDAEASPDEGAQREHDTEQDIRNTSRGDYKEDAAMADTEASPDEDGKVNETKPAMRSEENHHPIDVVADQNDIISLL